MISRITAALVFVLAATGGYAQDYPTRAITITVPNPPGGMNQIHAQPFSAIWEKIAKQPAPVVNRPGATSALGTAWVVVQQPADGYSLLVSTANLHLVIEKDKLYGAPTAYSLDQVELLALLSADPIIMVAHPSLPVKTAKEVAALARSKPNEIVFSSSGVYGVTHTPMQLFMDAAKVKMRHLPTTGGGPMMNAILGGHAKVVMSTTGISRVFGSDLSRRHTSMPSIPGMLTSRRTRSGRSRTTD